MSLSPRWHKLLLALHILAAVGVLGAALVLAVLGQAGWRGADPHTIYPAAHLIEAAVVAPLAAMALITGVLQAALSGWGLLRYWWVAIKLVVTAALTLAVFLVLEPGLSAAAASPGRLADAERLAIALAPIGAVTLGILNLALGVYKPRRRLRRSTGSSSDDNSLAASPAP